MQIIKYANNKICKQKNPELNEELRGYVYKYTSGFFRRNEFGTYKLKS